MSCICVPFAGRSVTHFLHSSCQGVGTPATAEVRSGVPAGCAVRFCERSQLLPLCRAAQAARPSCDRYFATVRRATTETLSGEHGRELESLCGRSTSSAAIRRRAAAPLPNRSANGKVSPRGPRTVLPDTARLTVEGCRPSATAT